MRSDPFIALVLAAALGSCTGPEEAPPPAAPPPRDPALEARIQRTRAWVEQHRAGCIADVVEVEMPADLREHCTFDPRGELFRRTDSREMHSRPDGRDEVVLRTVLEAQTPNVMATRCLVGKVEIAALKKLRITFSESAGEISIRGVGGAVWWIDAPEQRERGGSLKLLLPPSGAGAP